MTHEIKAIRRENEELVVFYEFANGEVNTNRFPVTASFLEISAWGDERGAWFDQREIELAQRVEALQEEIA